MTKECFYCKSCAEWKPIEEESISESEICENCIMVRDLTSNIKNTGELK